MRNFVIALAAAASALALASPAAAAQYYPQPQQPYGYGGQPYGYANDYGNPRFNSVHALQARIDALQSRIRWMDRANVIRGHSASRLREEARDIEKRLRRSSRYGLNPYELNSLQVRIARLEQRVQFAGGNRFDRGGHGYNGAYSNGGYYADHDRDDDRGGRGDWDDDRDDHDD
jgi:hypothetical protein